MYRTSSLPVIHVENTLQLFTAQKQQCLTAKTVKIIQVCDCAIFIFTIQTIQINQLLTQSLSQQEHIYTAPYTANE